MSLARVVAVALAWTAVRAHAGGFERAEQSPEGVATAGAQTADAYSAAAAYYNPAALAFQRGLTLQGGAVVTLSRATAMPSTGAEAASSTNFATPAVFVGQRVAARFAVGVGVFDPFAASTHYASAAGLGAPGSVELRAVAVNPSLAIRPLPWIAVGFGLDVVPTTLQYVHRQPDGTDLTVDVRGTGIGGNAALLVRALPRWLDLGVAYRSAIDVELSSKQQGKGTLPLPHSFAFGAASRPLAGLTLTADVRLTLWQDFASLRFAPNGAAPYDLITLNWQNSIGVRAGASYQLWRDSDGEPRLAVRIGGGWDQAPTSRASVDPAFADGDRIVVAAGAGARWRFVTVDAGYMAAIVQPFVGAFGAAVSRYQSLTHTVAVALTFRLPELGYRVDEVAFKR
jgi:long-chain fatty acid transport protein